jgi:hypothetical protein
MKRNQRNPGGSFDRSNPCAQHQLRLKLGPPQIAQYPKAARANYCCMKLSMLGDIQVATPQQRKSVSSTQIGQPRAMEAARISQSSGSREPNRYLASVSRNRHRHPGRRRLLVPRLFRPEVLGFVKKAFAWERSEKLRCLARMTQ